MILATLQADSVIVVAVLVAAGLYLATSRNLLRVVFGFLLLSNAANLVLLAVSGDPSARAAPLAIDGRPPPADPLPQALILTAIVIGFAVAAYLVFLCYRVAVEHRSVALDEIEVEPAPEAEPARPSGVAAAAKGGGAHG